MLLQDLWAIENKEYDQLRDKFLADVRKAKPAERASMTMREWIFPRRAFLRATARKMLQMSNVVQVTNYSTLSTIHKTFVFFTNRKNFLQIVCNTYDS